jgi:hypothetical protein
MSMPSGPVYVGYNGLALDAKNVEALIETAYPLELARCSSCLPLHGFGLHYCTCSD